MRAKVRIFVKAAWNINARLKSDDVKQRADIFKHLGGDHKQHGENGDSHQSVYDIVDIEKKFVVRHGIGRMAGGSTND